MLHNMSISRVKSSTHRPLTDPEYVAKQRAKYSEILAKRQKDYLKPSPLGPMKPMPEASALAMPLLNVELQKAIQISMEPSIYTIDADL